MIVDAKLCARYKQIGMPSPELGALEALNVQLHLPLKSNSGRGGSRFVGDL